MKKKGANNQLNQSTTAMFFSILYVVSFLDVTHAWGYYECPNASTILPCKCESGDIYWNVFCESAPVDEVRGPLGEVAKINYPVFNLTLERVHMSNLASNLFVVPDVYIVIVSDCFISTVDENAFVAVADKLTYLYLTRNPLEQIPSQALQKLFNLEHLFLDDNAIQVIQAEAFKGLHSLLELSLSGNRIKFIDDSAFVIIGSKLKILNLGGNEMTAVPGQPLIYLSSLRVLKLNDNKIASMVPEDLDTMGGESLSRLILANNSIKYVPARVFRSLKKLMILDLAGNTIDAIHPLAFEGNEGLISLKFGFNRLEEIPSASLKNLSRLYHIDLSGNSICKVQKYDFAPHGKHLEWIFLQNNSLKYVDPEAFIGLDVLRSLYLQTNQLNAVPFGTYSSVLDTLEEFDIQDNPLHCDCGVSWLVDWINGNGSGIVVANETSCATPQEHAKKLLLEIPSDQLVCENPTLIAPEPCCNCVMNHQERLSGDGFATVLQLGFILLITVVLGTGRLF